MNTKFLSILIAITVIAMTHSVEAKDPKALVKEVVKAMGGMDNLQALKDVEYTYTYRDNASGKEDISTERYIFDGEFSWAEYTKHEKFVMPNVEGNIIQGYDGKETWIKAGGKFVENEQAIKTADFLRKTNFYWFTMMFKLLDPGIIYSYEGIQEVEGIEYEKVKITFEPGVGDVADIYLLYIHPETKMVDQFLFTVMDFGMKDPLLMKVRYEEVDGLKLPSYRKYQKSDWEAKPVGGPWVEEISENIKFNNAFSKDSFSIPQ